jgi:hypothetical protein
MKCGMMPDPRFRLPPIRCREIGEPDLDGILDLLAKSPFGRPREFWVEALHRLGAHATPPGYPRYGYMLEVNGAPVGALLVISALVPFEGRTRVICNVSSWYVWPPFRPYGSLLVSQALKRKEAIYTDISPLPHTLDLLAAQGFKRYCEGRFIGFPAFKLRAPRGIRIVAAEPGLAAGPDLSPEEITVLLDHSAYGFISLVVTAGKHRHPFVFEPTSRFRLLRSAYLAYSRDIEDLVRFAGPIGRYLARRGFVTIELDANARVPGLLGWYRETTPKYYKGTERPRYGDIAYSERAVLGLRFPARVTPLEEGDYHDLNPPTRPP